MCKPPSFVYVYGVILGGLLVFTVLRYLNHTKILGVLEVFQKQTRQLGLQPHEVALFRDLLHVFDRVAQKHGVQYFLYGGTLMGFQRNNSILPWDDDFDLAMDVKDYEKVDKEFKKMANYTSYLHAGWIYKVFSNTTYTTRYKDLWNWPFLDIFLMRREKKKVTDKTKKVTSKVKKVTNKVKKVTDKVKKVTKAAKVDKDKDKFTATTAAASATTQYNYSHGVFRDVVFNIAYNHSDVFPLRKANFMGMQISVPRNVTKILEVMYGVNATKICESNYLDHRYVKYQKKTVRIECEKLKFIYKIGNDSLSDIRRGRQIMGKKT